jgi:hypothetical protein
MITNKIVSAKPIDNCHIEVVFKNGNHGLFNMAPYLNEGIFQQLKDEHFFHSVRVEYGTLVWPGDIDIAPDTVESELQPLP